MLPPRLPETLEFAARGQFATAMMGEPAELVELGARLLDRIAPPNWTLEWSLPGWLGSALGLAASSVADLTLANVFGLAYIKLQDDLSDGEMAGADQQAALLLSSVLHRKWLLAYTELFPGDSPFWGYFEQYMMQWVRATWAGCQEHSKSWAAWSEEDFFVLGHRGAPLKVCAAAAGLLAQQEGLIPQLESALDHLLIGAVLLDHVLDWEADLTAGRYNAFVAYTSARPQTAEYQAANRRAVTEELLVGKAGRPYFQLLRRELAAARALAHQAGCDDLVRYITWLRGETLSHNKGTATAAHDRLQRAIERLFTAAETHAGV